MPGYIDLHCHLLPALDDGPPTMEDSVLLARALVADGVTTVAATPHRTTRFITPLGELWGRLAELRSVLAAEDIPLNVLSGSEVAVDAVMDMDAAEIDALRLGGTGPLLVELSMRPAIGDTTWPVRELLGAGVPVLLAHPERIPLLQGDLEPLAELIELGADAQVTSGALIGRYGPTAQAVALAMLDRGLITVIASDSHHHERRPPEITPALAWLADARPNVDGMALAVHTPGVLIPPQAPAP
jgi:protein-tyrosine phosphatase